MPPSPRPTCRSPLPDPPPPAGEGDYAVPPLQAGEGGARRAATGGWGLTPDSASLRHRAFLRFALFRLDRLLGRGVDPPGIKPDAVFRRHLRTAELVPISHPKRRVV